MANEESWSYYIGSWMPDVVAAGAGSEAALEDVSIRAMRYPNAGGGGINIYKGTQRILALDWHKIGRLGPKNVLHWHWGLTKRAVRIHRGFFTGRPL